MQKDLASIDRTTLEDFCKLYSLEGYQEELEDFITHIEFSTEPSCRCLTEKAKVLRALKKAANHKLVFSDIDSDIMNKTEVSSDCLPLLGEGLAENLLTEWSMLHFHFIYEPDELQTLEELKKISEEWDYYIMADYARELNYPTFAFDNLTLPMIDLIIKMFENIDKEDAGLKTLRNKPNQLIGYYGLKLSEWYAVKTQAKQTVCSSFAFDLLYLSGVLDKQDFYVNNACQGNPTNKYHFLKDKIRCYKSANVTK